MKTSYLLQGISLLGSLALLVLVLAYLSTGQYLQWVLFTTIAGATIQLEMSLNTVMTRYVAHNVALGRAQLVHAAGVARRVYHRFATLAAFAMFAGGGVYLGIADAGRFSPTWLAEWGLYCAAFLGYYVFNHHSCVLVALDRARDFARIGIAGRIVNVGAGCLALARGYGIWGLCVATAAGFAVGAAGFRAAARRALGEARTAEAVQGEPFALRNVFIHASYAVGAYALYRVGLILNAAATTDTAAQASYGLALQIYALILTFAAVPLNMRVTPLVRAVAARSRARTLRELGALAAYTNLVYLGAVAGLVACAGIIGDVLPDRGAELPSAAVLAGFGAAFLVEINILVLVNVLLAARTYRFAGDYYASGLLALALGAILWAAGAGLYQAFVIAPALVQLLVAMPLLWRRIGRETGISPAAYLGAVLRQLGRIVRHPIRIGLAFR